MEDEDEKGRTSLSSQVISVDTFDPDPDEEVDGEQRMMETILLHQFTSLDVQFSILLMWVIYRVTYKFVFSLDSPGFL